MPIGPSFFFLKLTQYYRKNVEEALKMYRSLLVLAVFMLTVIPNFLWADAALIVFGPEELVMTDGAAIEVSGYSVPSFTDWNNDSLGDLVVGEGGGSGNAMVRVYLNVGTELHPRFADYFYVQSDGNDLVCPAEGCMGCFPRVFYWDQDNRKDLLIGQADGTVMIFLNMGTDEEPTFDSGSHVTVGTVAQTLDVGKRATPTVVDWDHDGKLDLVVGGLDGLIHIYKNCGCGGAIPPQFYNSPAEGDIAMQGNLLLEVPSRRSSPAVIDMDGDDLDDLLTGNTDGQLLYYKNIGDTKNPLYSDPNQAHSDGFPIDIPGEPRSRPFVCYWTGSQDGYPDMLIGAGDGKVRLYRGIPKQGDIDADGDVDLDDLALLQENLQEQETQ